MDKSNLLRRVDNAVTARKDSDEIYDYSYSNFMAIAAIVELRFNLLSLLNGFELYYYYKRPLPLGI